MLQWKKLLFNATHSASSLKTFFAKSNHNWPFSLLIAFRIYKSRRWYNPLFFDLGFQFDETKEVIQLRNTKFMFSVTNLPCVLCAWIPSFFYGRVFHWHNALLNIHFEDFVKFLGNIMQKTFSFVKTVGLLSDDNSKVSRQARDVSLDDFKHASLHGLNDSFGSSLWLWSLFVSL